MCAVESLGKADECTVYVQMFAQLKFCEIPSNALRLRISQNFIWRFRRAGAFKFCVWTKFGGPGFIRVYLQSLMKVCRYTVVYTILWWECYSSYFVDVPESDEGASMASEHSYTVPTDSTDGSGMTSPTGWFQQACHVNMCTQCTI